MSLIDEALKRARDEAALREQEGRRTPLPQRQGGGPPSAGGGRALAIGLAAGALVCLLAYAAFRFAGARPENDRPHAPAAANRPAPLPEVIVPPPGSTPAEAPRSPARLPREERTRLKSGTEPAPTPGVRTVPASPAGEAKGQRLRNGETFSRTVELPSGSRIELEGIVYSDTRPVALINGKVVAPGDVVEGFTVVKITPDRVELQNREMTISVLAK